MIPKEYQWLVQEYLGHNQASWVATAINSGTLTILHVHVPISSLSAMFIIVHLSSPGGLPTVCALSAIQFVLRRSSDLWARRLTGGSCTGAAVPSTDSTVNMSHVVPAVAEDWQNVPFLLFCAKQRSTLVGELHLPLCHDDALHLCAGSIELPWRKNNCTSQAC